MKTLFVGGPKDGLRQHIPPNIGGHVLQTSVLSPPDNRYDDSLADPTETMGVTTHTYTLKNFNHADGSVSQIAVDSSVKDIMKQLVKGYRYHRNPRRKY